MIKLYLKQAWELLRQNKLFSTLYVVGTGLAIAMTMIMAIIYYVKMAPVYPEVNRLNTLYLTASRFEKGPKGDQRVVQCGISHQALQDWFYPLKNARVVSASLEDGMSYDSYIQPVDRSGDFPVSPLLTDPAFFRIYAFRFLEGTPFTDADLASGIRTAVITEELSRRLFGTAEGVVGRTFSMNYADYRVCGVVRSASYLTRKSFAQLYVPYSVNPGYRDAKYGCAYMGSFKLRFLVADRSKGEALREEIKEIARKHNLANPDDWQGNFWEQPITHVRSVFQEIVNEEFDSWAVWRRFLLIWLVLLLVPALNLGGMIAGRMEQRLPEMGVRKSFGAGRKRLLSQVMWENLLLTLLGGALGLVLAWLAIYVGRDWVFTLFDRWPDAVPQGVEVRVAGEMLFAPLVFLAALLLCVVLNLLSALIPAWHSLRNPIVNSLNEKR